MTHNPGVLDLRVGLIAKAIQHPDADNLYVLTIHCGDSEPRTVVSGLAKHIPLETMQDRLVILLCNLKPSKFRGITSQAMVLAGSDSTYTKLELVEPPAKTLPGTPAIFDGHVRAPLALLPPKKKLWEQIQPKLRANASGEVGWTDENGVWWVLRVGTCICKLPTLREVSINSQLNINIDKCEKRAESTKKY
ncbi:hypothetical protein PMAC_002736 [Pneumocystis sp. 'macacae']|nr:hypothetical protein PMAC_002736 [Pneumocystis sp. 'macacae']